MERWEEEERILRKEFAFTCRSFRFYSSAWMKTITLNEKANRGYVAYAYERVSMYASMADHCSAAYESITGEALQDDTI